MVNGEALREFPDQRYAPIGEAKKRRRPDRKHHHHEHRGDLGQPPLQRQDQHNPGDPDGGRGGHRLAPAEALNEADEIPDEALAAHREPEEFRELADQDGDREAVHVADHGGLGDEVRDEAELGHGREDHDDADHQRKHRREHNRLLRVAVGRDERQDRRRDHRAERGVRPQHQDAGRAEDCVGQQAQDGGVQPGDRRQPCQLRVGHALGNKQRRQHNSGDDILAEPAPLVLGGDVESWHQLAQPARPPLSSRRHRSTLPGGAARCILRRG